MMIHMFAFQWVHGVTAEQKAKAIEEIRGLQGKIPGLLETFVGENGSPRGHGYELGGVMKFTDAAAFAEYGGHPAHRRLLAWLMPIVEPLEVDFEA